MKQVYFISGLGGDKRAFESLDLSFCTPVHLDWLIPELNEKMEDYALRMKSQISDPEPVIIGLSFGGIVAMELAKHVPFKQIILISSAKTYKELPWYFRMMKYIPVHHLVKPVTVKKLNAFAYQLMGIQNRSDKLIFKQMFREADDRFISWAIDKITNWENLSVPPNTIHIHGTYDILLPHFFVRADHSIAGGKHLMPMIQPELISALLKKLITPAGNH